IARVGAALRIARVRRESEARLSALNRDLQHRVAELETLLSVIPVAIAVALDRSSHAVVVNPAFTATLGLPSGVDATFGPSEETRQTLGVRDVDGEELSVDRLPMQIAAREGREVRDVEFDVVHEDGHVDRILSYAVPLFDERGESRGSMAAFVNISDRR